MSPGTSAPVAGVDSLPHFVLVPMMAAGHAGPMLDLARALSRRGALVTFVTTPLNQPRLGRAPSDDELPIRFLALRFPCAEAGLPEGCESLDALPGLGLLGNFNDACAMLRGPLLARLREGSTTPPASCVVSRRAAALVRRLRRLLLLVHAPDECPQDLRGRRRRQAARARPWLSHRRRDIEGATPSPRGWCLSAEVMDCGEEGSARRARAAVLGRKAREAVAHGGSSYRNVALLIQHVMQ